MATKQGEWSEKWWPAIAIKILPQAYSYKIWLKIDPVTDMLSNKFMTWARGHSSMINELKIV